MTKRYNNKTLTVLLVLSAPLAASCGEQKLVDLTINNPCNQAIWLDADKVAITVQSETLGYNDTSTFTYDNHKANLPFAGLADDAVVTVSTLDSSDNVTSAITFGPLDMTGSDKLVLNVAPGRVEAFNVTTEIENQCGKMNYGRVGHTATTLKDGRILIVGGETVNADGTSTPVTTTEIYDPATSKFTAGPELKDGARKYHAAVLLNDGKVFISGGLGKIGQANTILKTNFVYNPETNEFTTPENGGGYLNQARANMSATLLSDGRVVLAGGNDLSNNYYKNIEIWDPESGISNGGELHEARAFHNALLLSDGSIAFIGGQNASQALDSIEIYKNDAIQNATYSMTSPRTMAAAAEIDHKLLITGGFSYPIDQKPDTVTKYPVSLSSVELVNYSANEVYSCGEMKSKRGQHQISILPENSNEKPRFLITGGRADNKLPTNSAEIITINNSTGRCDSTSEAIVDMVYSRAGHVQATMTGGDILFIGGQDDSGSTVNSAEYYVIPR